MALQLQLENGSLIGGGGTVFKGAAVHAKPLDHGSFGHYRTVITQVMVADMAANARILEIRNGAANLLIPTSCLVTVLPVGGVAVPYAFELGLYKYTSFSAVDTANVLTPNAAVMRTSGMSAAPGGAVLRRSAGGVSAGMAGGTLTKDQRIGGLLAWMASVSSTSRPVAKDLLALQAGEHPLILAANEGVVLENVAVGSSTSNDVKVLIEFAWAEVPVGGF